MKITYISNSQWKPSPKWGVIIMDMTAREANYALAIQCEERVDGWTTINSGLLGLMILVEAFRPAFVGMMEDAICSTLAISQSNSHIKSPVNAIIMARFGIRFEFPRCCLFVWR